jgi:hypothetical protein
MPVILGGITFTDYAIPEVVPQGGDHHHHLESLIRKRFRNCSVSMGPKRPILVTISEPAGRLTKKGRPGRQPGPRTRMGVIALAPL